MNKKELECVEIEDKDVALTVTSAIELFFMENPKGKITKKDFEDTKRAILKIPESKPEVINYIG